MINNLRSERIRAGMQAVDVAALVGVSENTLLGWERGDYEPKASHVIKLTQIYHCTAEYLLGITNERIGFTVTEGDDAS